MLPLLNIKKKAKVVYKVWSRFSIQNIYSLHTYVYMYANPLVYICFTFYWNCMLIHMSAQLLLTFHDSVDTYASHHYHNQVTFAFSFSYHILIKNNKYSMFQVWITFSNFWKYWRRNWIGFSGRLTQSCTMQSLSTRWIPCAWM